MAEKRIARFIVEDPFVVCPHCGTLLPFEGDIKITDTADLVCKKPECGEKVQLFLSYSVLDILDFETNAPILDQLTKQTEAYRAERKESIKEGVAAP